MSTRAALFTRFTAELPPPADGQGAFDCAPLHVLAQYMRDRTWLDVKTGDAYLRRVRIVQIVVRRRRDDVVLRQDWLQADRRGNLSRGTQPITVDARTIWRAGPTSLGLDEVTPWNAAPPPEAKVPRLGDEARQRIVDAVIDATAFVFKVEKKDLLTTDSHYRSVHHRHQAIIVIYEMSDMRPVDICKNVFGYASQQPFLSAWDKAREPTNYGNADYYKTRLTQREGFLKGVKSIAKAADAQLAPAKHRRPKDMLGHSYTPVLP